MHSFSPQEEPKHLGVCARAEEIALMRGAREASGGHSRCVGKSESQCGLKRQPEEEGGRAGEWAGTGRAGTEWKGGAKWVGGAERVGGAGRVGGAEQPPEPEEEGQDAKNRHRGVWGHGVSHGPTPGTGRRRIL